MAPATLELKPVSAGALLAEHPDISDSIERDARQYAAKVKEKLGYTGPERQLTREGQLTADELDLLHMLKELNMRVFHPKSVKIFKEAKAMAELKAEKERYQPTIDKEEEGLFIIGMVVACIIVAATAITQSFDTFLLTAAFSIWLFGGAHSGYTRVKNVGFKAEWELRKLDQLPESVAVPHAALNLMLYINSFYPELEFGVETLGVDPLLYVMARDAKFCIFQWDENGFKAATI